MFCERLPACWEPHMKTFEWRTETTPTREDEAFLEFLLSGIVAGFRSDDLSLWKPSRSSWSFCWRRLQVPIKHESHSRRLESRLVLKSLKLYLSSGFFREHQNDFVRDRDPELVWVSLLHTSLSMREVNCKTLTTVLSRTCLFSTAAMSLYCGHNTPPFLWMLIQSQPMISLIAKLIPFRKRVEWHRINPPAAGSSRKKTLFKGIWSEGLQPVIVGVSPIFYKVTF